MTVAVKITLPLFLRGFATLNPPYPNFLLPVLWNKRSGSTGFKGRCWWILYLA